MASVQLINDERSASALADLLNGNSRRRPVAVVTIPAGRPEPWIDVEEIAREAGSLADVCILAIPRTGFSLSAPYRTAKPKARLNTVRACFAVL